MAKEKWGTKRTCPKCATRFYDLGKEDPVVCIECENEWVPEALLKSRQPHVVEAKKPVEKAVVEPVAEDKKDAVVEEELDLPDEDDEGNPDDDLDIDDSGDVADVIPVTKTTDEA